MFNDTVKFLKFEFQQRICRDYQIKKIINIFLKSQYYQELKVSIDNADNFFKQK